MTIQDEVSEELRRDIALARAKHELAEAAEHAGIAPGGRSTGSGADRTLQNMAYVDALAMVYALREDAK